MGSPREAGGAAATPASDGAPAPAAGEARIALVRHARSAHVHAGWVDAAGVRAWRDAYEAASIAAGERVPAELAALAAAADVVAASDAPRAVASARLLAPGREVLVSPLLRELDLHPPSLAGLALPLPAWALAIGLRIGLLTLLGRYPSTAESARVDAAATWLDALAREHRTIVVATHASFRRRLHLRLLRLGWESQPGRRSLDHWSAWLLTRPG